MRSTLNVHYAKEFPGISAESSPALRILTTERHGTPSKGTRLYWKELVAAASERQKANKEFPVHISVLTRRVRQTLAIALWRVNAGHILQFRRRALEGARRVVGA